jgi:hypothetical protein
MTSKPAVAHRDPDVATYVDGRSKRRIQLFSRPITLEFGHIIHGRQARLR